MGPKAVYTVFILPKRRPGCEILSALVECLLFRCQYEVCLWQHCLPLAAGLFMPLGVSRTHAVAWPSHLSYFDVFKQGVWQCSSVFTWEVIWRVWRNSLWAILSGFCISQLSVWGLLFMEANSDQSP